MLNKIGPSIEPCATPAIIFSQELKLLLARTHCCLSFKYLFMKESESFSDP